MLASTPWLAEDKETLDLLLARILFLYRRVAVSGDEDLAKEQLRSQLREKVVVDRETVWSQMVSGHRGEQNGIFRSISPELESNAYEDKGIVHTPLGRFRWPVWLSGKAVIFLFALALMLGVVQYQPFSRVEESNCTAMLLFCTILWATEVGGQQSAQVGADEPGHPALCDFPGCTVPRRHPASDQDGRFDRCADDSVERNEVSFNKMRRYRLTTTDTSSPRCSRPPSCS